MSTRGAAWSGGSPELLARHLNQWALAIPHAGRESVRETALMAKHTFEARVRGSAPGMRLEGVGKSGARLAVKFDVVGAANPTALVRAVGPLQLIENDTRPHVIIPRRVGKLGTGRGSRSAPARHAAKQELYDFLFSAGGSPIARPALKLPNGFRGRVQHKGTTGKRPWARAKPLVVARSGEIFTRHQRRAMARIFTGG